jgi:hypothetical protein
MEVEAPANKRQLHIARQRLRVKEMRGGSNTTRGNVTTSRQREANWRRGGNTLRCRGCVLREQVVAAVGQDMRHCNNQPANMRVGVSREEVAVTQKLTVR